MWMPEESGFTDSSTQGETGYGTKAADIDPIEALRYG
jgi:hypothetical protein